MCRTTSARLTASRALWPACRWAVGSRSISGWAISIRLPGWAASGLPKHEESGRLGEGPSRYRQEAKAAVAVLRATATARRARSLALLSIERNPASMYRVTAAGFPSA